MLANAYITPNATSMLIVWFETRARLWLDPLKITISPATINTRIAPSSGPSTWAARNRVARLISGAIAVILTGLRRGRLLAEQIIIEHLARDRRRRARTETRIF